MSTNLPTSEVGRLVLICRLLRIDLDHIFSRADDVGVAGKGDAIVVDHSQSIFFKQHRCIWMDIRIHHVEQAIGNTFRNSQPAGVQRGRWLVTGTPCPWRPWHPAQKHPYIYSPYSYILFKSQSGQLVIARFSRAVTGIITADSVEVP